MALMNVDALNEVTLEVLPLREPTIKELIRELWEREVPMADIKAAYFALAAQGDAKDESHPANQGRA